MNLYKQPIVSIVLGAYNRCAFLKSTIESVRNNSMNFPYEIIVVDGGSTDGSLKYLCRQKDVITIVQHNRGTFRGKLIERRSWGYFMNLGFKCAQGKYICMLSDDCLLVPGAVENGVKLFEKHLSEQSNIGAVAFYWRNWPEQTDYCVGTTLGGKLMVNHGLYLRDAINRVGWIDEHSYHFYHADGDLSLKLWREGYEVIDCPDSFVEHYNHANFKVRKSNFVKQQDDWSSYLKKWENIFYYPDKPNIGSGIYREYHDHFKTYIRFPIRMRFNSYILRSFKRMFPGIIEEFKRR
jgi:glycosyltransferase involved in cell wall biosynthesis